MILTSLGIPPILENGIWNSAKEVDMSASTESPDRDVTPHPRNPYAYKSYDESSSAHSKKSASNGRECAPLPP